MCPTVGGKICSTSTDKDDIIFHLHKANKSKKPVQEQILILQTSAPPSKNTTNHQSEYGENVMQGLFNKDSHTEEILPYILINYDNYTHIPSVNWSDIHFTDISHLYTNTAPNQEKTNNILALAQTFIEHFYTSNIEEFQSNLSPRFSKPQLILQTISYVSILIEIYGFLKSNTPIMVTGLILCHVAIIISACGQHSDTHHPKSVLSDAEVQNTTISFER